MNNVIQILPADGWMAKFDIAKDSLVPIACWALMEDPDGKRRIEGILPASHQEMRPCDEFEEFMYYIHESKI